GRRTGYGLYRAGGAIRELDSSGHDPFHFALGGFGGAVGAVAVPHGTEWDRADRGHFAFRHREEESDHDDRLCAGGGAKGEGAGGGGDLSGLFAALSAYYHDDDGSVVGRFAAGARNRSGIGTAAAAGDCDSRRFDREPDADPLHNPGDLSLPRPSTALGSAIESSPAIVGATRRERTKTRLLKNIRT